MAKYLYKLGKWAVRHRKKVIGGTIGILLIIGIIALSLGPSFSEDMSIPPGTESAKAGKNFGEGISKLPKKPAPGT